MTKEKIFLVKLGQPNEMVELTQEEIPLIVTCLELYIDEGGYFQDRVKKLLKKFEGLK